jgi:hypothetical protein
VVVTVPVATNRVTTISFPGPITAVDAVGVTADPKAPGQFQLAHTPGAPFFSVRALSRKAATNLNIRWNRKTYVIELVESDLPALALSFEPAVQPLPLPPPDVTPTRLLALLDKAKAFPLLRQQHPSVVSQVDCRVVEGSEYRTDSGDMEIQTEEIYRFNPEDTLVFRVTLRNKTELPLRYRPNSFMVRAGDRLYSQSISDASGVINPQSVSTVYFAITGTPDGARNELSLQNHFRVFVTRVPSAPAPASPSTNAPPQAPE